MSSILHVRPWAKAPPTAATEAASADASAAQLRLVEGLRSNLPWARAALIDRYGEHVRRVLVRVLGAHDSEIEDLAQETFLAALQGVQKLTNPDAFAGWLTSIAVFSARSTIRRRQRWRWLRPSENVDQVASPGASAEMRDAAACVYRILNEMPADERVAFSLRMFEGYELEELAEICDMSLATLRRRLASAQKRFDDKASRSETLAPWMAMAKATQRSRVAAATEPDQEPHDE